MIERREISRLLAIVPAVFLLSSPSSAQTPASGQASGDPWSGVEEMLVVGSGSEGILATTGTAVTSFDATALEALGIGDVGDIAEFTPNLEIKTAGATAATLFIRGIGLNDFTANGSGSVAVYQDDVSLNLPAIQLGQLFDVSEVQVVKGPIGTGSGRNASAGAIKIFSNKPSGDLKSGMRFDYGNYNFVDSEGYIEVPVIEDVLSSRISYRVTNRDGIMENRCARLSAAERLSQNACGKTPIQVIPAGLEKNLNDLNSWAIRGLTRFVPPVADLDMDWLLGVHLSRIDQLQTVGQSFGASEGVLGFADQGGYQVPEIKKRARSDRIEIPDGSSAGPMQSQSESAGLRESRPHQSDHEPPPRQETARHPTLRGRLQPRRLRATVELGWIPSRRVGARFGRPDFDHGIRILQSRAPDRRGLRAQRPLRVRHRGQRLASHAGASRGRRAGRAPGQLGGGRLCALRRAGLSTS